MRVEEKYDLTASIRMWFITGETTMIIIQEEGEIRFYEEVCP